MNRRILPVHRYANQPTFPDNGSHVIKMTPSRMRMHETMPLQELDDVCRAPVVEAARHGDYTNAAMDCEEVL